MSLDAYSVCPGGTGKKIKFCCPDFVGELQKIVRLLEGEQHIACLQHVDRLLEQGKPRACLMAFKATLLQDTQQFEAAKTHAQAFLQQFPENPIAMAEAAIVAAEENRSQEALQLVHRAMEASGQNMYERVYEAMGVVAECRMAEGDWFAGSALLRTQMMVSEEDQQAIKTLVSFNRSPRIPLLMKYERPLAAAPLGAPWAPRLQQALEAAAQLHWQEAADRLTALSEESPTEPAIWSSLASVRGWLGDRAGMVEALQRYAALDIPLDDAVEAETLAMLLLPDPLGDVVETVKLTFAVRDAELLKESLLSEPRVVQIPFDPAAMSDEETPPPRAICFMLDRPAVQSSEGLTLEAMPKVIGQAMLFGRQTDREARLEVMDVAANQVEAVGAMLAGLAGDAVDLQPQRELMAKTSASREQLVRKWYPPRDGNQGQLADLAQQHMRHALLEQWPDHPLDIFGGKSPREAAAEPANRVKLLAAIMLLDMWCGDGLVTFDFDQLRGKLGLPTPAPIDPEQSPVAMLPLVRLWRLMVEKLSDKDLTTAFNRSQAYGVRKATRKFAQAIVERDSMKDRPELLHAYQSLAETAIDVKQSLEHIEQWRQAMQRAAKSCAMCDLMELSLHFGHGNGVEAMRVMEHIHKSHIREQGVAETLTQMLIEVGILRPDGTPRQVPGMQEAAISGGESAAAAESGKLWTPDSEQSGSGGGKIWTPG